MKNTAPILALFLLAAALWWVRRPEAIAPQNEPAAASPAIPTPAATPVAPPPDGVLPQLAALNATGSTAEDVRLLDQAFIHYQRMVKDPGGNPVGLNAEITRALCGRNRAQLAFIATNHPAINAAGELCDRWGRPYFFHALSGHSMQIRSSGPDQRMWTGDDVVSPEDRASAAGDTSPAHKESALHSAHFQE